ncbi:MAG: hypothetical protein R3F41_12820 [Gammaproteobacteria bacterium]|nr:hypothetical protein [Pseudomonadales bacterium]
MPAPGPGSPTHPDVSPANKAWTIVLSNDTFNSFQCFQSGRMAGRGDRPGLLSVAVYGGL